MFPAATIGFFTPKRRNKLPDGGTLGTWCLFWSHYPFRVGSAESKQKENHLGYSLLLLFGGIPHLRERERHTLVVVLSFHSTPPVWEVAPGSTPNPRREAHSSSRGGSHPNGRSCFRCISRAIPTQKGLVPSKLPTGQLVGEVGYAIQWKLLYMPSARLCSSVPQCLQCFPRAEGPGLKWPPGFSFRFPNEPTPPPQPPPGCPECEDLGTTGARGMGWSWR